MRERKQSDSPSGFDRELGIASPVDAVEQRRLEREARAKLAAVAALEDHARQATKAKLVTPLVQEPAHEFRTPIVDRFDSDLIVDHMLAPGSADDTGFGEGCIV